MVYLVWGRPKVGFLLLELMLALLMLLGIISSISLYHVQTYELCCNTKKRHEALNVTRTVIETLHATHKIVPSTFVSGVAVAVKPISCDTFLAANYEVSKIDSLIFLEICTSWKLTSGLQTSARFITCMQVGT